MYEQEDLLKIYENVFRQNFKQTALIDYVTKESMTYCDLVKQIERIHILFEIVGIKPGDKIALMGKNSISWISVFMASLTYGSVIVPILHEFHPNDARHIINHSESKLFFVSESIYAHLDIDDELEHLQAVFSLDRRKLLWHCEETSAEKTKSQFTTLLAKVGRTFRQRYPNGFGQLDFEFKSQPGDNLALLNYTSGTTGFSKGVMLTYNNLMGNVVYGINTRLHWPGSRALSFLPLAHAYGCAFDMLAPLAVGTTITLLGQSPTPNILLKAMAEIKPTLIICVPLVLEKIYKKVIVPMITKAPMRWVLAVPMLDKAIYARIRARLVEAFGGEFEEIIVGGAPLNAEVEDFLHKINFPFTVGYGMTECGPLISYTHWREFVPGSSGDVLPIIMEAKIESPDPQNIPGEIKVRGVNVMKGYFKNPEATEAVLDKDGWLSTGDMGTLGGENGQKIFIRGRCKTMLLGANGQNIYPEEIESKINNMPFVTESLVVDRGGRLVALVYPDSHEADRANISDDELPKKMEEMRRELNQMLAPYEQISRIQLMPQEFEKTPKRSIKRFLYS